MQIYPKKKIKKLVHFHMYAQQDHIVVWTSPQSFFYYETIECIKEGLILVKIVKKTPLAKYLFNEINLKWKMNKNLFLTMKELTMVFWILHFWFFFTSLDIDSKKVKNEDKNKNCKFINNYVIKTIHANPKVWM